MTIYDAAGTLIRELEPDTTGGINRMVYDLRYPRLPAAPVDTFLVDQTLIRTSNTPRNGPSGSWAIPGLYTARLIVNSHEYNRTFTVGEDPRIQLPVEQRPLWTETLLDIADLNQRLATDNQILQPSMWQIKKHRKENKKLDAKPAEKMKETGRLYSELFKRIRALYSQVSSWPGAVTADQQSQWLYYQTMCNRLIPLKDDFIRKQLPNLNKKLAKEDRILTNL